MTDDPDQTVFVVMSRKMDSPHPFCEAVYDNRAAAKEHKKQLADSIDVVAWDVHERSVHTATNQGGQADE